MENKTMPDDSRDGIQQITSLHTSILNMNAFVDVPRFSSDDYRHHTITIRKIIRRVGEVVIFKYSTEINWWNWTLPSALITKQNTKAKLHVFRVCDAIISDFNRMIS